MIDRLAPARRPHGSPTGYQTWRELLFIHWSYPLELVRPLVPAELQLDAWEGRAWVGAVPFVMKDIRLAGMPRWSGLNFLETNLRTYVLHDGEPGVFFFSLEANSRFAVRAARLGWRLPYFDARISLTHEPDGTIDYRTTRKSADGAHLNARFRPGAPLGPSKPGSLQHFLLERYLLFNLRDGVVWRGHVHHAPYAARQCELLALDESLTHAAGLPVNAAVETVHYSDGVEVDIYGPHPKAGAR